MGAHHYHSPLIITTNVNYMGAHYYQSPPIITAPMSTPLATDNFGWATLETQVNFIFFHFRPDAVLSSQLGRVCQSVAKSVS